VDWRPGDTGLVGMPGFHIGGLDFALQALNAGCSIVSMPVFVSEDAVRLVIRHRVNTMIVTPAMLHMMLDEPDADRASLASLRTVIYGGSPIPESLLDTCMRTLDCGLLQIYGSTESGNVVFRLPPKEHVPGSPALRSAGLPGPDVRFQVVDADDRPVPAGTIGEVCVRTPTVMLEYWNNPAATARTLRGGWLHMGDVGYLDETGHLFLCARVNDTIIVAGENIYPAEIENALAAHPAVADVAVLGVPDEQWGERVHACVVLRADHTVSPRELMRFLNGRVADFKVPTGYTFVDAVPRNATGKILRRDLLDQVLAGSLEELVR
jgi:acyl-CoA synthetase (AMP-forming)/AMP-acid ligase II